MTLQNASTLARQAGKIYGFDHHDKHRHEDVVTAANLLVLRAGAQDVDIADLDVVDITCSADFLRLHVLGESVSTEVKERETTLAYPWKGKYG